MATKNTNVAGPSIYLQIQLKLYIVLHKLI